MRHAWLWMGAVLAAAVALVSLLFFALRLVGVAPPGAPSDPLTRSTPAAVAVDVGLWVLFALQHSGQNRRPLKRRITRWLGSAGERSLYVFFSGVVTLLLAVLWQPLPGAVWNLSYPWDRWVGLVALGGLALAGISSMLIDGLDLIGLRRPWLVSKGRSYRDPPLDTPLFYRWLRHPLQAGVILLLWGTGHMSVDRLVMAVCGTLYILLALPLEERDLVATYGDAYRNYQGRVPRLWPRWRGASLPDEEK